MVGNACGYLYQEDQVAFFGRAIERSGLTVLEHIKKYPPPDPDEFLRVMGIHTKNKRIVRLVPEGLESTGTLVWFIAAIGGLFLLIPPPLWFIGLVCFVGSLAKSIYPIFETPFQYWNARRRGLPVRSQAI